MRRDASRFADVELSTTPAETAVLPTFVAEMSGEWRAAFQSYRGRHASIGSVTGIEQTRAARILEGAALAKREEAAAIDSALGTNASRLFPIGTASIAQRAADAPIVPRGRHAMPEARKARARAWDARVAAYGQSLGALALATGIGEGRVRQIVRSGTLPTVAERMALDAALGEEA